ncbi:MAG: hypothetical protein VB064_08270 [Oscillospiraceae bacterium]|nr:hypothetical protein [Oscillospiraceae bacterium]
MEKHTIIGIQPTAFDTKDGTHIRGSSIYVTAALDPKRGGQGQSSDKFFLTDAKLAALDFTPAPGQVVAVLYNRFGKVQELRLLDESVDFGVDE